MFARIIAAAVLSLSMLAPAQAKGMKGIPLPPEKPQALMQAQASSPPTNPDPFNIKRTDASPPPATSQPAPIVVTTMAPPPAGGGILGYIWAAIAAGFMGIFGKLSVKLPALPNSGTAAGSSQSDISTALKAVFTPGGTSFINDPALRSKIDAALLDLVKSGVPGTAIQSGISLIPGAGAIGGILEPIARKAAEAALEARLGHPGPVGGTPAPVFGHTTSADQLQPLVDQIMARIEAKLHPTPANPAPVA